jgi:hypothetical protein
MRLVPMCERTDWRKAERLTTLGGDVVLEG